MVRGGSCWKASVVVSSSDAAVMGSRRDFMFVLTSSVSELVGAE